MDHVGTVIDRLIKQQGMTQKELSERSGITTGHLSLIVSGKCVISIPSAVAIANGLRVISAREILNHQTEYQLNQYEESLTHAQET